MREEYDMSLCFGAHAQAKAYGSLLVFLSVCASVCYRDSASTRAIQVLKHAQMGIKQCFLGFKICQIF